MTIMQALANIPWAGPYIPYMVLLLAVAGTVAHAVAPYVAPPTTPYGWRAAIYGWVNAIAGNRGQALNATDPSVKTGT